MDWLDRLREKIVATIIRDIPKTFWEEARARIRQAYLDFYHEVAAYPGLVDEQRLEFLHQFRFFRMEHLLSAIAVKHGLVCSPKILATNGHHYVYVTGGHIGLTQAYVPAIGEMPQPARFREQLSRMNGIPKYPRLDLGDEPREVLIGKEFYGLLAHNPVGRRFTESDQRLGSLQFCVPVDGCTRWALQVTIEEVVVAYPNTIRAEKPGRVLPWKKRDEGKDREDKK